MTKTNVFTAILVFISMLCHTAYGQKTQQLLQGSWELKQIHWIKKDTTISILSAQPGMFMVTPTRYSIMWTPTDAPRKPFAILSQPTDDEIKPAFQSIAFNSGTYEVTDTLFTAKAKIAKVPGFEGGKQIYTYKITNNKLELKMIDETYPDGTKPSWSGKMQALLVFQRID